MQHKIYLGSQNPAKLKAVQLAVEQLNESQKESLGIAPAIDVVGEDVPSGVAAQPMGDEETITGAEQRCLALKQLYPGAICIGLEGGVEDTSKGMFLTNWGVLIDTQGERYYAGGVRILLPAQIREGILAGEELGPLMNAYAGKLDVPKKEGAIGIFSDSLIDRSQMFSHVVLLLFGQKCHHASKI